MLAGRPAARRKRCASAVSAATRAVDVGVSTDAGFHSPDALSDEGTHMVFANLAVPALVLSQLLVIAATIVWAVRRRREPLPMATSATGEQRAQQAR